MDKEEILKKSREENEGQDGEYEKSLFSKAYKVSNGIGVCVCLILAVVSRYIFASPEVAFAGFIVLFSTQASLDLTKYVYLKEKRDLIYGIVSIIATVVFSGALVYFWMTSSC